MGFCPGFLNNGYSHFKKDQLGEVFALTNIILIRSMCEDHHSEDATRVQH